MLCTSSLINESEEKYPPPPSYTHRHQLNQTRQQFKQFVFFIVGQFNCGHLKNNESTEMETPAFSHLFKVDFLKDISHIQRGIKQRFRTSKFEILGGRTPQTAPTRLLPSAFTRVSPLPPLQKLSCSPVLEVGCHPIGA